MPLNGSRRRLAALATGSTLIGLAFSAGLVTPSNASSQVGNAAAGHARSTGDGQRQPAFYDARAVGGSTDGVTSKGLAPDASSKTGALGAQGQASAFVRSLGGQAAVDIDPLTGTPRQFGRLDGYLSAPSSKPARTVALDFVRAHAADLGLSASDLATLRLARDYVDPAGLHHLSWTQVAGGRTVFGNGLKVSVTRDGRVLDVQGSPVHDLQKLAAAAPSSTKVSAASARATSARDVGTSLTASPEAEKVTSSRSGAAASTKWANHDYANLMWFLTPTGLRPGWSTYTGGYQHVVDAVTSKVLYRRSDVQNDHGDARVFPWYPGAKKGGKQVTVNLFQNHWLPKSAKFLKGTSVTAWADVNDDNAINPGETTPVPGTKKSAQFTFKAQHPKSTKFCSKTYQCSWKPDQAYSWKTNMRADVTNAFYLANRFHDWLENGPAKFTPKAGNFSATDNDPVLLQALDGANSTGDGYPDANHIDNANMETPPDGTPPTMQMYLWHSPGTGDSGATGDPFLASSGAFDPSVLFHEFTHGLSNRLVVDATGNSTLNDLQAGSMGEAWSDYYAMDYLVRAGYVKDTNKAGEVFEGSYLSPAGPFRTMAIDCPVRSKAKGCSTALDGKAGGYTYGEIPTIGGTPEVHASGEVWAQTLWDIRKQFGSTKADQLITRAMSISADDPSMLDMRNAIVQADLVSFGGNDIPALWNIFARRGMGYFAGSEFSADAHPAQNFNRPPDPTTPRTSISGTVTDPTTGDPVAGAKVTITGFGTRFSTTTNAGGQYTIANLYPGTYPKVVASAPGFVLDDEAINTRSNKPSNFSLKRDWAASSGGGEIADFNGPDFSPQCGPTGAIDLSLGTGWGSTTGDDAGTPTNQFVPKHITVKLPQAIDISSFGIDPANTCGDPGSSSTGAYSIETSTDGTTFTKVGSGTFVAADRGRLNTVTPTAGNTGVTYVRFTILGNQVPDFATNCPKGAFGGCTFTDMTELAVFGTPAG